MKLLYHHPLFNHFVCVDCRKYFCFVCRWYSFAFSSFMYTYMKARGFVGLSCLNFFFPIIPCDDRIMYNIVIWKRQPLRNICCGTQILVLQAMLYCQEILAVILKNGWIYTMSWWRFSLVLFFCVWQYHDILKCLECCCSHSSNFVIFLGHIKAYLIKGIEDI